MMRAAIYARFSTELQNEKSTEDQIALCRAYAVRNGLSVVAVYEDRARSGASVFGRDGLTTLMEAARQNTFDTVVVEALDRLSRDMADLAGLYKRLSFLGIEIQAVHDGTADAILIGIRGLVGQMQREDGAKKVRRGMAGVIRDGRHAGGRAYGYRAVPGRPGELEIVKEEAEIVRQIFAAYASGRTPRDLARDLNREGVAPPRGTRWNGSTINGNAQRGAGVLFNELYVGRLIWNKVRMVKNPDTGKRVSRANPKDQWQTKEVPHLRIIDDETWQKARALKTERVRVFSHIKRRPSHLLSGLLRCGVCGSGLSVHDRDKSGKTRVRCSAVRESGSCSNRRILYLPEIEKAVLDGMREQLKAPELIEAYVRKYNEERRRLAAQANAMRTELETKRDRIEGERQRTIDLVIKSVIAEEDAKQSIAELKTQRLQVEAQLAGLDDPPSTVALHPATLVRYIETVDALSVALADHATAVDDRGPLTKNFRALVHSVTVQPKPAREGFEIEVKGKLATLIGGRAFPDARYTERHAASGSHHSPAITYDSGFEVVAEEGLEPPTPGL
ncbi:recombinase family protein [Mesorhizobium sp. M1C.F.Ca.ET.193.01.1.1]|nr:MULTISPECIES: recombinase family protein [unclassified Mesorhizobium]TGS94010.1 recombinase family protein [bacterium M00.F.Ca.ET.177.01.1.1]TGQ51080.1 recombinase family protein [Mesorhizobium sp. M1C.F.Ca.ET.210.01.1.1]TGQ66511.1 recombinase family protein [Mesorhizobium sp. M1C.F.Ca.ET.212.01.1.1]TGR00907.1 recombinase family protein [Mesorhizobium sp. M1C.F.Ca.ET.204.01.1.1]TGR21182.1 recombinase family protein [Mesorhizobium sp. M1C.F.Ca.ET.196.01.1.1]